MRASLAPHDLCSHPPVRAATHDPDPSRRHRRSGIAGFQRHHQRPFLEAFPDRRGAGHHARLAEGPFVASTGWPSVLATHAGSYLGVPATQRAIGMRVMDWWRREGAWLTENWVLIDLPHLMLQMGLDVLAPLQQRGGSAALPAAAEAEAAAA